MLLCLVRLVRHQLFPVQNVHIPVLFQQATYLRRWELSFASVSAKRALKAAGSGAIDSPSAPAQKPRHGDSLLRLAAMLFPAMLRGTRSTRLRSGSLEALCGLRGEF